SDSASLTRRSRRGGSSRFAVKVFSPPVARSWERAAKSTARSCAILSESSVIGGVGVKGPEGKAVCGGVLSIEWVLGVKCDDRGKNPGDWASGVGSVTAFLHWGA